MKELKATTALRLMGGHARNIYQLAQVAYRTNRGYRSTRYAYAATYRAILAKQITRHADGSITTAEEQS